MATNAHSFAEHGRLLLCAGAILIAGAGVASAQTAPIMGVYLRGDIGAGIGENVTFTDVNPTAPNCDLCGASFPASANTSVIGGGGIGYRFSPMLRAEVTVEDLSSFHVNGTSTQPGNPSGGADLSALVVMANGYLDLNGLTPGAYGPIQPYLVAGVGASRNDAGSFSAKFTTGPLAGVALSESGATRTSFAWGLGIGAGYPLSPNLTLDFTYKYLDLGELRTGSTVTIFGGAVPVTASKSGDFNVHTLTASLRIGF